MVLARVKTHLQLRQAERDRRVALDQQQELNAMRARFVAMTTHEFRTPLTNILSSQQLLRHYGTRLPEDEKADLLDAIASNVRRMTSMLDRVLLLGQAEAQMLEFKPKALDLKALLHTPGRRGARPVPRRSLRCAYRLFARTGRGCVRRNTVAPYLWQPVVQRDQIFPRGW